MAKFFCIRKVSEGHYRVSLLFLHQEPDVTPTALAVCPPSSLNHSTSFPADVNISDPEPRADVEFLAELFLADFDDVSLELRRLVALLSISFNPALLPLLLLNECLRSPSNSPADEKSGLTIGLPPGPGGAGALSGGPKDFDVRSDQI